MQETIEKTIGDITIKYRSKDYNRKTYVREEFVYVASWVVILLAYFGVGIWIITKLDNRYDIPNVWIFISEFILVVSGMGMLIYNSCCVHSKNKIPQYNILNDLLGSSDIEAGYFNKRLSFIIGYKGYNSVTRSAEGLLTGNRMSCRIDDEQVQNKSEPLNVIIDFTDPVTKVIVSNKNKEEK